MNTLERKLANLGAVFLIDVLVAAWLLEQYEWLGLTVAFGFFLFAFGAGWFAHRIRGHRATDHEASPS